MAIISKDDLWRVPLVMVMVCWECEYLQVQTGRYSSHGPRCGECEQQLDTYKVIG